MFQGMARGKVGSVVFSRRNGEQISYAHNPNHRNPKSNGQIYQRAIWTTCLRAYSAGKVIFDHAFEGYRKGTECQQRFMVLNTKLLRRSLIEDINSGNQTESQLGRFNPPGTTYPVPFGYQISEGKLPQILTHEGVLPSVRHSEKIKDYCRRKGIQPNDLFTVVFIQCEVPGSSNVIFEVENTESDLAKYTEGIFGFVRLNVKADCLTNDAVFRSYGQLFDVSVSSNLSGIVSEIEQKDVINADPVIRQRNLPFPTPLGGATRCYFGCIHSRINEDVRSSSFMADNTYPVPVQPGMTAPSSKEFGTASNYVMQAWRRGTVRVGDSSLILEGGD